MQIREHVALAPLTTFNIGGAAQWLAEVSNEDELIAALRFAHERGIESFVLGGGSNTLFPDEGFNGLVVLMKDDRVSTQGETITSAAGAPLMRVVEASAAAGLSGLEKFAGIPGSIGGAVRGNAGAFGIEMKDIVESVRVYDGAANTERMFNTAACAFGYRESIFKAHPEWVITQVTLRLTHGSAPEIERIAAETIAARERKHIQDIQSAGSFFVNPVVPDQIRAVYEREGQTSREGRVPAGWLLDRANVRGMHVGGAQSSMHHANYFLNTGGATAAHVCELARLSKRAVEATDGITLTEEVTVVPSTSGIRIT